MGRLKSRTAAISRRIPRLKEPIKASRWIEKLVSCQSVAKALALAMEPAPAMAERRFRSKADIFPDEVAETCPGRYGGEAEVQTRVPSPFDLAARKGGQENSMRAIGLVLLSIAIMALLLTNADAKRRSSAQGSQAAGASGSWCATYPEQGLNDNCSYSSFDQCYQTVLGRGGFCRPNPFPGTAYGTGGSWSGPRR
jgi:hypothetical protein